MTDRMDGPGVAAATGLSVLGVAMYMLEPLYLGAAADSLGYGSGPLGFLVGAEIATTLAASLSAPLWITRISPRRVASVAVAVALAGNLATPFADSYLGLLAVRLVTGTFGAGLAYTLAMRLLAETTHPERAYGLCILAQVGYATVGLALLPPAIEQFGFAFLPLTWAGLAALLLLLLRHLPNSVALQDGDPKRVDDNGATRAGWLLLVVLIVWNTALGGVWAFIERVGRGMALTGDEVGMALAVGMLVSIPGSALATWMGDRFGTRWPVYGMILAHLSVFYALSTRQSAFGFLALVAVLNFAWNLAGPFLLAAVARRDRSGPLVSLIPACQTAGAMAGPAIGGLLVHDADFAPLFWFAAACYLVMSLALVMVFHGFARTPEVAPS